MDILEAVAQYRAIGLVPSKQQVQGMAGMAKTEAAFVKYLGQLRKDGFISKGSFELTPLGVKTAGDVDTASFTNEQFQEKCLAPLISKAAFKILQHINDGKKYDKMEVAKDLNYDLAKISGFNKDVSKMGTLGLLDQDLKKKEILQLTDMCFPRGRPE